jgi:CO/xanthine dehydrogenase FAD-binding subunit
VSRGGSRWIPYDGFHIGYKQMNMRPDELLTRIRLPRNTSGLTHYYRKVGTRKAQAISKVCFSAVLRLDGTRVTETRIALGSVAPIVLRAKQTEDAILGNELNDETMRHARETLMREIAPIDDVRSTASYRLRVAANLLVDFLMTARS